MPRYAPIADRLIAKVDFDRTTHCMHFTGSICADGYGKINGGLDMPGETLAHRAAYRIWCGEIPEGKEIDHRCRNRSCINPQHLEAVTHAINTKFADHSATHRNRRKTHCKHGHAFTEQNTIREVWKGSPRRKCRTCTNAGQTRRKLKRAIVHAMHPAVKIIEV